ncbi:MAG TPA: hypothetical protein VGC42_01805 [Kofleriaceae bacterium]
MSARRLAVALIMLGCQGGPGQGGSVTAGSGGATNGSAGSDAAGSGSGSAPSGTGSGSDVLTPGAPPAPPPTPNALPYTLELVAPAWAGTSSLPALHAYSLGRTKDGKLLIVGGRITQGLHMFTSTDPNFPRKNTNSSLWVIDPKTGDKWSFDTAQLGDDLAGPLSATNAQGYQDPATDQLLIAGGYGWSGDNMKTFNTIVSLPVSQVAAQITAAHPDPARIKALIKRGTDPRFAVTGGALRKLGSTYYLLFGQSFQGQYRAFGGSDFTQAYADKIAQFTLQPSSLKILSYGELTSSDPSHPYHRRDGNVIDNVDPATGAERITAFGGVFMPGKIAAYTNPVFIDASGPTVDSTDQQRFSQYQCPVIVAYDPVAKLEYHTFVGGISGTWFSQSPSQHQAYLQVTAQGRNDGLPFIADITSYVQKADGSFTEWILPSPIPGNQLLGASIDFVVANAAVASGLASAKGVLHLDKWHAGDRKLVGYLFGGIAATNPLPLQPNSGTVATNQLFEVYVTLSPSAAYPASAGHAAVQSSHLQIR